MKSMNPLVMGLMALIMIAGLVLVGLGVAMHVEVNDEEDAYHELQDAYFTLSKAERDAAETGSALNEDLVEIKNSPSTLLRLKLVGIGWMLTGIFTLLFGILLALITMPRRLAELLAGKALTQPTAYAAQPVTGVGPVGTRTTAAAGTAVGSAPSAQPSVAPVSDQDATGIVERFDDTGAWALIRSTAGTWYAFKREQLALGASWDDGLLGQRVRFQVAQAPDLEQRKAGMAEQVRLEPLSTG